MEDVGISKQAAPKKPVKICGINGEVFRAYGPTVLGLSLCLLILGGVVDFGGGCKVVAFVIPIGLASMIHPVLYLVATQYIVSVWSAFIATCVATTALFYGCLYLLFG